MFGNQVRTLGRWESIAVGKETAAPRGARVSMSVSVMWLHTHVAAARAHTDSLKGI